MSNNLQGSFQGGSLNYLYQMGKVTGDNKWTGDAFIKIADFFIDNIQQENGFFSHVEFKTKKPPKEDPQDGLHRANDDLGTLGLLCAYKISGDKRYLNSINKFLTAVFAEQRNDGSLEGSTASIPIVLNTIYEGKNLNLVRIDNEAIKNALTYLYKKQSKGNKNPRMRGGMIETNQEFVHSRSSCYALIFLLKLLTNTNNYLSV